jgi:hypothetical protein
MNHGTHGRERAVSVCSVYSVVSHPDHARNGGMVAGDASYDTKVDEQCVHGRPSMVLAHEKARVAFQAECRWLRTAHAWSCRAVGSREIHASGV